MKNVKNRLLLCWILLGGAVLAQQVHVSNEYVSITYTSGAGTLQIRSKDSDKAFLDGAWSTRTATSVDKTSFSHAVLGKGESINLHYPEGRVDRIMLFDAVEFVCIQPTIVNQTVEEICLKEVDLFDGSLDLLDVDSLKALGTAGLTAVDGHTGSYMFLALADPETRSGVVGAWLSSDRGNGIVFSGKTGGKASLKARIDYGRLLIRPGESAEGEIFMIGQFDDVRAGLEKYADLVAQYYDIHLLPQPDGYCTWYSRPHGRASDEVRILELSAFATNELKPYGLDFIQIDDYWQDGKRRNGPAKVFERVDPNGPYKGGMKPVAEAISDMGLTPGIWWMPFAGDRQDPFFADKQGWFTNKKDGTPYHTPWGGTALDMTNPDVRNYSGFLAKRMAEEWGYKYFKMDGIWMGTSTKQIYVNNGYNGEDDLGTQRVYDPYMTPIEAYRAGFKEVRSAAGNDVFFLGCCISQNMRSFGASFGLVDAMRVGPDNNSSFSYLTRGPWHGANRYFLHRKVWYNDPDPLYVRPSMPIEQAQLICSWVAISGQLSVSSEWYPELPPERLDLIKRTLPNHGLLARPVDLLENPLAKIWILQDHSSGVERNIVGLFNWSDRDGDRIEYPLSKIGLDPEKQYIAYDFWNNRLLQPFGKTLSVDLQPGCCRVLSVREVKNHPLVISTSRHITQGVVDISREAWNAKKSRLTGSSQLVANDLYELRMVVPTGSDSWKLTDVRTGNDDVQVMSALQDGPIIRVQMRCAKSGTVDWTASFEHSAVKAGALKGISGLKGSGFHKEIKLNWDSVKECTYMVTRNDGIVFKPAANHLTDTDVKAGKTYTYQVSPVNVAGVKAAPAKVQVAVPQIPVRPPVPPVPEISITQLEPVTVQTSTWKKMRVNNSAQGKPLKLDGQEYADGVGLFDQSLLVYSIPEGARRFVGVAGIDDAEKNNPYASVVIEVYGDVKEMGEPPVLLDKSPTLCKDTLHTWCFDVELSDRQREIRLVVTDAGDGNAGDYANWVNAGFIK